MKKASLKQTNMDNRHTSLKLSFPVKRLLTLCFTVVFFCTASPAHAVIPQLLGPLTALLSIIPQILAFVGIALITALVFARDTVKMLFYKFRDAAPVYKIIVSVIGVIVIFGTTLGIYQMAQTPTPVIVGANNVKANRAWATFRGNKHRTGHLDARPGPTNGTPAWVFKEEAAMAVDFSSSPAVAGNRLYIGSSHGSIFSSGGATYCIDIESREVIWRHVSPTPIFSSPAVAGGRVYIGEGYHEDSNCHLRCLDAKTGEQIWSFQTASHVESTPFISQGKLYFTAGADGIYCIDALEGQEIWHYKGVHADMSPVVHEDKLYFGTGYGDYQIYAVDAQTGTEIWSKQMPYPVWGSPSASENLVFFGLGRGNLSDSDPIPAGKAVALDVETGDIVWEHEAKDAVHTAIAVQHGNVTFGSRDGSVYCLRATDGKRNWQTGLGSPVVSSPAVTPDMVYAATKNGYIYALSTDDGKVKWEFNTRTVARNINLYSSPAVANGFVYIGSSDRYIFSLGDGKENEIVGDR